MPIGSAISSPRGCPIPKRGQRVRRRSRRRTRVLEVAEQPEVLRDRGAAARPRRVLVAALAVDLDQPARAPSRRARSPPPRGRSDRRPRRRRRGLRRSGGSAAPRWGRRRMRGSGAAESRTGTGSTRRPRAAHYASGRGGGPAVSARPATVRRRAACPDHGRRGLRRPPPPGCAHGTRNRGDRIVGRRPRRRRDLARGTGGAPGRGRASGSRHVGRRGLEPGARGVGRECQRHPQRRAGGRGARAGRRGCWSRRRPRSTGASPRTREPSARTGRSLPPRRTAARRPRPRSPARARLDVVVVRPFPHTGPGQSETFAIPSFAAQIARIEAGLAHR